ncbi:unnamed protein product [Somion occarium]|uniref:Uncharacterized protein n=1 Tax=Somion occarium TaxID=3059160 RepID=A0ABP1DU94_9APHY
MVRRPPLRLQLVPQFLRSCSSRITRRVVFERHQLTGIRQESFPSRHLPKIMPELSTVTEKDEPVPRTQSPNHPEELVYHGLLRNNIRAMKLWTSSSLMSCVVLTPVLLFMEIIPPIGVLAMAGTFLTAYGAAASMVSWCGGPYVFTLRWLPTNYAHDQNGTGTKEPQVVEITTMSLTLNQRITRVYDTAFLLPTIRPFATWELAEFFRLSPHEVEARKAKGVLPGKEVIAETLDKKGVVIGKWVVHWNENGSGACEEQGRVSRYFKVHEELLPRPVRWGGS